ncbi:hypothetical protein ACS0TY_004834 [Phlomoides rotata]
MIQISRNWKLSTLKVKSQEDHVQNFMYLHQLEKLKVTFYARSLTPTFPKMLKKLSLEGGRLPWKDMSVIGSLPGLEVLKLIHFAFRDGSSETWETADGEFPQPRFLLIQESFLKVWITECSQFPRLKCLVLRRCLSLREIPDVIGEIPKLELIDVDDFFIEL